ncbi:MAG: LysM peptidoglycan-binding domain-containing protein [Ekhidna sp.]|uniref:LysM peptidoglycan-binding domain-containing protein n=1 Tax=Ekhidna sp. TaxID=2608089 RepID=UPI0032EC48EA
MRANVTGFEFRVLSLIMFIMLAFSSLAQTVPSEMMIGDVRLSINESARKQIQQDVDRLTQSQTYFNILVDRMNLYFPYIEREHKKAGVPDEIKFLALQESALISDAVSSANAVGFWQFKDFTGREVGLIVDRKVDERLNIVSSSRGSGKYFNSNNFYFDNWAYAVIAYQAGAGGAKNHTDKSNYGSKRLNITTNTYWYLKKFIAHVVAFSPYVGQPHSEGIWLDEITNAGGKSMEQIAREEKVDIEELKKYNKWLMRGTVPEDKTYSIMVPRQGTPPKNLIAENSNPRRNKISEPQTKVYPTEIKPGITEKNKSTIIPLNGIPSILARATDDVHSLSARAGISEKRFRKYNDIGENDKIISNEFYYIKKKKGKAKIGFHVAKKDESLWDISQQYGIQLSKLAQRNRMSIIDELKSGRVLWMDKTRPSDEPIAYHELTRPVITKPVAQPTASTVEIQDEIIEPEEQVEEETEEEIEPIVVPVVDSSEERRKVKIHTVAAGESLWAIAKNYEVKLDDLLRWNDLPNPDAISIGQNIQVKAPIEEASAGKNIISHTVEAGETLYAISRKYNMTVDEVMDLNGMKTYDLSTGQALKVYGGSTSSE